ncbi:MAG: SusC/RagA family TonB-linked outer membrane protein [Bacteroidales bacterium]|nr:SusC/RagA family TonB-linked outer membrane protein [Bacteroidales bacterium]
MRLFFTMLAVLVSSAVFAQNISVSGHVKDAKDGSPIPFASVHLKGTMTGVSSDADGYFSITVPSQGLLVFSSIGYKTQEVSIDGRRQIEIIMENDTESLDETIVVAYGTATKSSFTGSAAVVNSEKIASHVSTNVTSALAGTTPGVQMISSSGDPASNGSSIRIRGIGSMSASSAPLYILDGMPYDGSISDINPNDVESISVLKDAAASAIYGARGANGVVLITTKKSSSNQANVKFDAKWGSNSRLIPQYDVISDPAQYYETWYTLMFNKRHYAGASDAEAYAYADANLFNEGNGGLGYQVYTVPEGQKLIGTNFKINPNATLGYDDGTYYYIPDNWYNEAFHNSFRQEYNLSASGSKGGINYYASAGYLNDGGIINNSGYQRYTARLNADYQAKSWLKLTTSMSYSHSISQSPGSYSYGSSGNIFYIANTIGPIYPLYVRESETHEIMKDASGRTVYDSNNTNFKRPSIVGNAVRDNEVNRKNNYADVLTGKFGVTLTPVRGLNINANVGLFNDNTRYNALYSQFGSSASTDGSVYVSHSRTFGVNTQALVSYKTDFGGSDHNFEILAGYEMYNRKSQSLSGSNDHLFNPFIGELNNADGKANLSASSSTGTYMTQGFLARAQYDYAGKYFISGSYRRDASSNFAKNKRWGDFGSVGLAWLISQEGFMSGVDAVDLLKLKASYGVQGNDNIGSFLYTDIYSHSYNEETKEYSMTLTSKGNPDLTWESSHSFNVGLDFELFDGYLNGGVEFFDRITSDLLYSKQVPLSSGNPTGRIPVNVGSISNIGVEAVLSGKIISTKNVRWDWNLNLSHYKNTILALDESVAEEGIKGSNYIYRIGGSLYDSYVRKYAGVDPETGKGLYLKKVLDDEGNWNGETETTTDITKADQFECGTTLPKIYGGLGMSFYAYGFDLAFQLSYQLGGKYYDGTYQAMMLTQASAGSAIHKDVLNSWTPTNTNTNIPRLDGDTTVGQTAVDRFFVSSNYLSVNNVTIGYTFPKKWTDKIKLGALRIYVAGENLAVASARKGVDPRYSMGIGSYTSGSGLNSGAYSAMRNISGGITLTF